MAKKIDQLSNEQRYSFWRWLVRGTGGRPGYRQLINWWLILHVTAGTGLSTLVSGSLSHLSQGVIVPLLGILLGLTFAWTGNVQALLQTDEIEKLSAENPGGFTEYVNTYQLAILIVFVLTLLWSLAGLGLFDSLDKSGCGNERSPFAYSCLLFFISSLAIRECWQVVNSARWLMMARRDIRVLDAGKTDKAK